MSEEAEATSAPSAEMRISTVDSIEPKYLRLVTACAAHGIKRSQAYLLARTGLLDTFTIGKTRFVYVESLETLPARLATRSPDLRRGGA